MRRTLNRWCLPLGLRLLRSAALLEYPRRYVELLDTDPALAHPAVRCSCGSDKVFAYGLPDKSGRHFYCRHCERAFTAK